MQRDPATQRALAGTLPSTMEALQLRQTDEEGPRVEHATVRVPHLGGPSEVRIEILAAGLCRTDLYVATGALPARSGLILGHEGAGRVDAIGSDVAGLALGDLVGIDPRIACGRCDGCTRPAGSCLAPQRLGVERDGVFAGSVIVPEVNAIPLAASVSPQRAAYLEPVAAAMGALRAGLRPSDRGAIAGEGRIAELTRRVLVHAGFPPPPVLQPHDLSLACAPAGFDFVIDAGLPDDASLDAMVHALRPGGTLVMKSRSAVRRSFQASEWVNREITVAARAYGSFSEAAAALSDPALVLEDLFGSVRSLAEHEAVFSEARKSEALKLFFAVPYLSP
ncbi:MAG: alcohol dehydrogenase catalytic domain-containing protein [Planctomycetota bacterium]